MKKAILAHSGGIFSERRKSGTIGGTSEESSARQRL
jgi:hypothetical protein